MMNRDFEEIMRERVRPLDTSGRYEQKLRATLYGLRERKHKGFGLHRGWKVAVVFAALCALSVGGVAYSLARGVLNFNEDFGWGTPIVSQEGAEAFVTSGTLAHASFDHVDVDVLEAVFDGTELRVVYSVTNRSGEEVERDGDTLTVPGEADDGVHMCDSVRVNGQDAFFDDIYDAESDVPGQVLHYLQTNLASWGVDVTGADELTIGLPLLPREEGIRLTPTLDFTISAIVPEDMVCEAALVREAEGMSIVRSSFSPVRGYIELELNGPLADRVPTGICQAIAPDDFELECHMVRLSESEGSVRIGVAMMPPAGEWPETFELTLQMCAPDEDLRVQIQIP